MIRYIVRRLLWGALLLIIVAALTFLLFRVLPTGNPALLRAGRDPQPGLVKEIERLLGLNKSLPVQFWDYMKEIFLHFQFGYSYYSQEAVRGLIGERISATLSLTVGAAVLWVIGGLSVGVISALRRHTLVDRFAMGGALVAISMPEFWFGFVLLLLFANDIGKVKIFPGAGSYVGLTYDPWKWFTSLILPWIVLASGSAAVFARLMRSSLSETMGEDYIRTARAKGLRERQVVGHGVRSAINPIVTLFGLEVGVLLGGALLVEIGVQHPRRRRAQLQSHPAVGLPGDAGHGAARRAVHHRREHRRGRRLRLPRSPGQVLVMEDGEPLLRVEDLRVEFPGEDGVVHAVDGITYQVHRGRTLGIVGESGSGKTVSSLTTLGLTRKQGALVSGRILFDGRDLVTLPEDRLRAIRGNDIAMIFQDPLSSLHPLYTRGQAAGRGGARPP